jgi:hypothetical protein
MMMWILRNVIVVIGLLLFVSNSIGVEAQTAAQTKTLRASLLQSYDRDMLPRDNQTEKVYTVISLNLLSINSFDMISQKLSVTGYLAALWEDEFLTWDPELHGGRKQLSFRQSQLWKPHITLLNSYKKHQELGDPSIYMNVNNFGHVTWIPFEVFETNCDADITYFPFDRQSCRLHFSTGSFETAQVLIEKSEFGIVTNEMDVNSEWSVEQTTARNAADVVDGVWYTIVMRRKPLFAILNIICPVMIMVSLNIFVMVLPAESGEKVGFAVTIMLALSVFLTIVSESIPNNSVSVSLLSVYLLNVQVSIVFFSDCSSFLCYIPCN